MSWIKPICDRTLENVNRVIELNSKILNNTATVEEVLEWKTNLKGALNKSDLERIVNNCDYLSDVLGITITTQTVPELPTLSWYQTLLTNIQTLISGYVVYPDTPTLPSSPLNTYQKWNDIEKILFDMNNILETSGMYFCSGEELLCEDNFII